MQDKILHKPFLSIGNHTNNNQAIKNTMFVYSAIQMLGVSKTDTMIRRGLTFSAIQIIALLLSFFLLAFALAGSHGRLTFSNVGGTIALIITIILSVPLLYLLTQRHKLQNRTLLFIIAALVFGLSMIAIYVG